jgi:hypothetical protein
LKAGSSSEQDWRCERDAHGDADAVCEKAIEKIEEDLCVVSPYHLHNLLPILDKDIWIFGYLDCGWLFIRDTPKMNESHIARVVLLLRRFYLQC